MTSAKIVLLMILCLATAAASQPRGAMERLILSRIYRVGPQRDLANHACNVGLLSLPPRVKLVGKTVAQIAPIAEVQSIETALDEIALPSQLIAVALLQGRFVDDKALKPLHMRPPEFVNVIFKGTRLLSLGFCPGVYDRAQVGSHWIQLPECVSSAQADEIARHLNAGKSRQEVEAFVSADGGISRPFRLERYVLKSGPTAGDVVKLNLVFKPQGMTDAVFYLGKWVAPRQQPGDTLMRISPPYREPAYMD